LLLPFFQGLAPPGCSVFPCCKGSAAAVAAYFVSPCSEEAAAVLLPLLFSFFLAKTLGLVALLACLALVVVPFPFFCGVGLAVWVRGRPPWHSRGALSARATLNSRAFGPYHNRLSLRARF